jgi:hypothetical protein
MAPQDATHPNRLVGAAQIWPLSNKGSNGNSSASKTIADALAITPGTESYNIDAYNSVQQDPSMQTVPWGGPKVATKLQQFQATPTTVVTYRPWSTQLFWPRFKGLTRVVDNFRGARFDLTVTAVDAFGKSLDQ